MMLRLPTLLIVDDSATTRAMIKRIIEMTELPVQQLLEAQDGRKALDLMKSTRVHLVLADLNMPVMGGAQMIELMRQDIELRDIPVLVISAQPDKELTERLRASGVAGYLPKPFTSEAVRDLVGPLLKPLAFAVEGKDPAAMFRTGLLAALGEALETMAFITPELLDERSPLLPSSVPKSIHVRFHGRGITGTLTLAAPSEFGAVVAANCGNENPNAAEDALKELANVTCGLLLRRLVDGARGFELVPPISDEKHSLFASPDSVVLTAEGYRVVATVVTSAPLLLIEEVLS